MIAGGNDRIFAAVCDVVGCPELVGRPPLRHATPIAWRTARSCTSSSSSGCAQDDTASWHGRLTAAGVPAAPVANVRDVIESPQTEALEMMQPLEHPRIDDLAAGRAAALARSRARAARRRHRPTSAPTPPRCCARQATATSEIDDARSGGSDPHVSHLSASFSATIRVRLADAPGSFARLAQAIGDAGGSLGAIDLVRAESDHKVRDVTVAAADDDHLHRIVEAVRAIDGVEVLHVSDRTFLHAPRWQARGHLEGAAQDARRPLDGLHARRGAHLPRRRRLGRGGLEPDDQVEHGRRRLRRDRGARPRRHRARGGDAGDGGQGSAVQGVRRHRRVADLPRDQGRRRDRGRRQGDRARLRRASTSRTSRRHAASRSSAACATSSTSRSSTTTSTARRSSMLAALVNALKVVGKRLEDVKIVITGVGAAGIATTDLLLRAGARNVIGCDRAGRRPPGPARARAGEGGVRRAHEPGGRAGPAGRGARRRRRLHRALRARARSRSTACAAWRRTRSCSRWRTRRRRSRRRRSRAARR